MENKENLSLRTKQSPRFENNALCIYQGDTFELQLDLNITQNGEPIEIQPTDTVTLEFRTFDGKPITSVEFKDITTNEIVLNWDKELTKKFCKGKYTYRMKYNGTYITTLVADNIILVS